MLSALDPCVELAQALIGALLTGPGTLPTLITAAGYTSMAEQFATAAAGVDASMTQLGHSWNGTSSDRAQAAFRQHSDWLRQQAGVAAKTALHLNAAAEAYTAANFEMVGVQAWLTEFLIQQQVLESNPHTFPLAMMTETESALILGTALGVMGGYATNLSSALAGIPQPAVPQPIVTTGGPPPPGPGGLGAPAGFVPGPGGLGPSLTGGAQSLASNVGNTASDAASNAASNTASNVANSATDAAQAANQPLSDFPQSPVSDSTAGPQADSGDMGNGVDDGTGLQQQGYGGAAIYSPTLAGLNGGIGSSVTLGLTRAGLGSATANTAVRMPSNWAARGAGRAFGAADAEAEPQVLSRSSAPKGASAPEAQMRRRRKTDRTAADRVISPGEEHEVPVLQDEPVIGVLEHPADLDAEPIAEQSESIGVLDRVDRDPALQSVSGGVRRG